MYGKIRMALLLMGAFVILMSGISMGLAEGPTGSPAPAVSAPLVLEIEDFKIENGKIVENKDASNGKAVVATSLTFVATKPVKLAAGVYEIVIIENAPNGSSDAINIGVNENAALRTYPNEATDMGKFMPCIKKLLFTVEQPGEFTIKVFTSNEMGALYDKILITKIK